MNITAVYKEICTYTTVVIAYVAVVVAVAISVGVVSVPGSSVGSGVTPKTARGRNP